MNKMSNTPGISDSEWKVMKVLWASGRATTNQVVDALTPTTPWKPKTIMTLLNRLVKKGAIGFEKKSRLYEYYPLVDEDACIHSESRSFIDRVGGGALKPMLTHFLDGAKLTEAEIEELKNILDRQGK